MIMKQRNANQCKVYACQGSWFLFASLHLLHPPVVCHVVDTRAEQQPPNNGDLLSNSNVPEDREGDREGKHLTRPSLCVIPSLVPICCSIPTRLRFYAVPQHRPTCYWFQSSNSSGLLAHIPQLVPQSPLVC